MQGKRVEQTGKTRVAFREVQRFRQPWLWLLVLGVAALCWHGFVSQVILGTPFDKPPPPDALLIIVWLVCGVALPLLFLFGNLTTEVREDGIYLKFTPFHFRFQKIPFSDVKDCQVRTYNPLREYGGWGIRYGAGGKAYNVSGNRGVQLTLASGKGLLIGSQRPERLFRAIKEEPDRGQP